MRRTSRIMAAVVAVALTGSIAGLAAAQSVPSASHGAGSASFLASVAANLGITPARLTTAVQSAELKRVESLAAGGRMTAAKAQSLTTRIDRNPLSMLAIGLRRRAAPAARARRAERTAAASYLGLSPAAVRKDRLAGQSLASIASSQGKSTAALVQAMLAPIGQRLARAVASGHLTAAKEQAILTRKEAALERYVTAIPHAKAKS